MISIFSNYIDNTTISGGVQHTFCANPENGGSVRERRNSEVLMGQKSARIQRRVEFAPEAPSGAGLALCLADGSDGVLEESVGGRGRCAAVSLARRGPPVAFGENVGLG